MSVLTTAQHMLVREAQHNDFAAVMALYRQLHKSDPVLTNGVDEEIYQHIVSSSNLFIYVAEWHSQLLATCYLNIVPNLTRSAKPYAIIENVVTDELSRSKGYGQAVVRYALTTAWTMGCYKTMLLTGSCNEGTHRFYQACGFRRGEKTGYVAKPTND